MTFDVLVLIGRPASGKSEIIDYLKRVPLDVRSDRFHIGEFEEVDDFPFVWEMFEQDDIMSRHGRERIFTDERYYFKDDFLWNFLIERINLKYSKILRQKPDYLKEGTIIVEFSRGGDKGYRDAFSYLSTEVLQKAAIMYVKVSYEESLRKNRLRARSGQEDSILYHSLPEDKMEFYYRICDWETFTSSNPDYVNVRGIKIPYCNFHNEPDVTHDDNMLGERLQQTLGRLFKLYASMR